MTDVEQAALGALAPIESSMKADGYTLSVTQLQGGALEVGIAAMEGACADCLVPESVMVPMIERLLSDSGVSVPGVKIVYPTDAGSH